ncbi:tetratricopeptide repeat protein [Dyella caseinilytica]|uniref:Tetratricopeptide repeat protein n=1 Tax=Dyella caseinilytica TaxID=1849581 RepID=A0ABX7GPD3_9GAMM|nr:tetratricopeptide repeat protein [Dyella caseinilytica]QRN52247.1 tetratricopeptide repeat protein [Dyella caseinilytica]GGA14303.1 hypothetical protein GCM10011408_40100 [Dyella caseinilytica]
MTDNLEKLIASIETRVRADDPQALAEVNDLIERFPEDARVWSLRSYIRSRSNDFDGAIQDMTQAIELAPTEPVFFFNRGRFHLRLGRAKEAIEDFTRGLEQCAHHQNNYYRDSLLFFRAAAHVRLRDGAAAAADLSEIEDDEFSLWIEGLVSKKQLMAEAEKLGPRRSPRPRL